MMCLMHHRHHHQLRKRMSRLQVWPMPSMVNTPGQR